MFAGSKYQREEGTVALTVVLVLMAILVLAGGALVYASIDLAFSAKNYEGHLSASMYSRTCLEEALHKLRGDPEFEGDVCYSDDGGSCDATITDDVGEPGVKIIAISAVSGDYSASIERKVDISQGTFQIVD